MSCCQIDAVVGICALTGPPMHVRMTIVALISKSKSVGCVQ